MAKHGLNDWLKLGKPKKKTLWLNGLWVKMSYKEPHALLCKRKWGPLWCL